MPSLTVIALVPSARTRFPSANDNPLRQEDPQHTQEGLNVEHNDERGGYETVQNPEAVPMVLEKTEVRQIDITLVKELGCNDGTYRPIGSRASSHYEVDRKDNEVRPHKVVGLTPVESPAERSNCIAT